MRKITIEIASDEEVAAGAQRFDVVLEDGRRCNGLSWDELLGQVAALTHPKLNGEHFQMMTPQQWDERRRLMLKVSGDPVALSAEELTALNGADDCPF
jgi:hypothetical protein